MEGMRYEFIDDDKVVVIASSLYTADDVYKWLEVVEWCNLHNCVECSKGLLVFGIRHYRFPSDEVRTWFILRWT